MLHLYSENSELKMEKQEVSNRRPNTQYNLKKKPIFKPSKHQYDLFITNKSNIKAQKKQCEDLLNSGVKEIFLHCVGNAINRCMVLVLQLVDNSNGALSYEVNTSTVQLIDELHSLCDDGVVIQNRTNSALHIRVWRNFILDEHEAALQSA